MNKKRILIIICILATIIILLSTLLITNNKNCKIGFYGLSENITNAITEQIENNFPDKTKIEIIDNTEELTEKKSKKYNIIFMYNGKTVSDLSDNLKEFHDTVYNLMPSNIGNTGKLNDKNVAMPILLDHMEIAYYRTYREQCNLNFPQEEQYFNHYLETIKEKAIFPLYLAGADDNTLLGFISLVAESSMSPESYKKLLENTYTALTLNNKLSQELETILLKTTELVKNQYIYRKWYENTLEDLDFAMKEHKVGSIVTSLSNHRKIPFNIINYYDSFIYPKSSPSSTAVIAPEICAIIPKNKSNADKIVEKLVHTETQTALSDATKLAPVNSRAQAHDMEADDVRFIAASTSGPLPSLSEGACKTTSQQEKLANLIRDYFSQSN